MANPERGEVDLVTPTKTYTLEMTTNTLCVMEQRTGRTFGQLLNGIMVLDQRALRSLLHASLQPHHAREFPNEDAAGPVVDAVKYKVVQLALIALFNLNSPPADEKTGSGTANPPEGAAAGGIGDNSTSTSAASD
jgi:hypothetical protein